MVDLKINILSLFPEFFSEFVHVGVIGRAYRNQIWSLQVVNPRSFADNRHGQIDDRPYGGGSGMVMCYEPLHKALASCHQSQADNKTQSNPISEHSFCRQDPDRNDCRSKVIYLSPSGVRFTQKQAEIYAQLDEMTLLCGRYEGIDQRFIDAYVDDEVSVGDFVLSGGEPAALCIMDAVLRLLPKVLGNEYSLLQESHSAKWDGLLDYPHYTRPESIEGRVVPAVLLQGDHRKIAQWRRQMSLQRTYERRADLLDDKLLSEYTKNSTKQDNSR